ncbi:helicase [Curvularia kusanoi]|uniref:Helicase n=1 Tax=Curvularia kusanoi TaxID=90978 RepID=A0A9P4W440_CURKU|nr:helicase [Curvularia kusanoi]
MKPFKPFKPLSVAGRINTLNAPPPPKKRRLSESDDDEPLVRDAPASRKPLAGIANPTPPETPPNDSNGSYYTVLWRKPTTKKNKTWDGDGVLAVVNGVAILTDSESGKELGKAACNRPLLPGSQLSVGGKELEIDDVIDKKAYLSGRVYLGKAAATPVKQTPKRVEPGYKPPATSTVLTASKVKASRTTSTSSIKSAVSEYTPTLNRQQQFKTPLLSNTVLPQRNPSIPTPRHDPNAPNALVMKRPTTVPKGKQVVDVIVDPVLSKCLRDHQREGVKFLYECVMGMRSEGEGAIMADEMGLGKTLQTIALIWTLLKQNPIHDSGPAITKALIVCPAGLVDNWKREFRKWLGNERIGVYVADAKNKKIANFTKGKAYNVLIIGYEMLRTVQEELKSAVVDIVIADEGHRLKTANNKSMQAIQSLNTERRVILSGTPLQNDLGEFYTAIDFVNPGLLGQRSAFKRTFEAPIIRSRQPDASESELEKGEARWQELVSLTSKFMIRRTADVLSKYLPPKTEHIVFCRPTKAQAEAYRNILASPLFTAAYGNMDMALQLITILKKVCNSPSLLKSKKDIEGKESEVIESILPLIPPHILNSHASSTKLRLLDNLVHRLHTTTEEKIVIVSNYTMTLDMIERLLTALSYTYLRLDGSTPASKRQGLVEKFNKTSKVANFAFLLSAKSGGVGLNLIGASRIVLFDIDWNPATDLQSMARIHRDGQKLPCKVYRFLVQGSLDEKIYQRQVMKMGLANAVVDNKQSASSFSKDELRDLFRLDDRATCQTHDLLGCTCECTGAPEPKLEAMVDAVEEEDSDDDKPLLPGLKKASEVDIEHQEAEIESRRKGKMPKLRMLMEYRHIDTKHLYANAEGGVDEEELAVAVDDDVFLEVLKQSESSVGFLLTKSSS